MECQICSGRVEWRGWRFNTFTHTECMACGAVNSHVPESAEGEEEENTNPTPSQGTEP